MEISSCDGDTRRGLWEPHYLRTTTLTSVYLERSWALILKVSTVSHQKDCTEMASRMS